MRREYEYVLVSFSLSWYSFNLCRALSSCDRIPLKEYFLEPAKKPSNQTNLNNANYNFAIVKKFQELSEEAEQEDLFGEELSLPVKFNESQMKAIEVLLLNLDRAFFDFECLGSGYNGGRFLFGSRTSWNWKDEYDSWNAFSFP
jgi:hypothetical protein